MNFSIDKILLYYVVQYVDVLGPNLVMWRSLKCTRALLGIQNS